jgi:hypothetical protein
MQEAHKEKERQMANKTPKKTSKERASYFNNIFNE